MNFTSIKILSKDNKNYKPSNTQVAIVYYFYKEVCPLVVLLVFVVGAYSFVCLKI